MEKVNKEKGKQKKGKEINNDENVPGKKENFYRKEKNLLYLAMI